MQIKIRDDTDIRNIANSKQRCYPDSIYKRNSIRRNPWISSKFPPSRTHPRPGAPISRGTRGSFKKFRTSALALAQPRGPMRY